MTTIIDWNLPISDDTAPRLENFTRSAGPGYSGREQIVSPRSKRWTYSFRVPVIDEATSRRFRVIMESLEGRFNYLRIRICDPYRLRRRDYGLPEPGEPIPYSQPVFHSDGTGFAPVRVTLVPILQGVASGNEIYINSQTLNDALPTGVWFSINGFLYLVTGAVVWEPGITRVTFQPALREPVIALQEIDFDPKFVGYLADDMDGMLDRQIRKYGIATIHLLEGFER